MIYQAQLIATSVSAKENVCHPWLMNAFVETIVLGFSKYLYAFLMALCRGGAILAC